MIMWWRSSRLDRIEANMEKMEQNMQRMQQNINELAEISTATNRRIDRFVEEMREERQKDRERTEQLQRAVEYLLSKDN
ncbi:hypothetical protein cce_3169 [Crocosphaera subtropica ATCC 51142]|uniref:Uncharacterized protein n=2 Tax=Crocosphaera TaxID=263510 RepID=B1WXH6_CROS5|nr:hypothetical protein cce_3169 [Crocosphaera subtropica ATCC 51142]